MESDRVTHPTHHWTTPDKGRAQTPVKAGKTVEDHFRRTQNYTEEPWEIYCLVQTATAAKKQSGKSYFSCPQQINKFNGEKRYVSVDEGNKKQQYLP